MGVLNSALEMFQPQIMEIVGVLFSMVLLFLSNLARVWLGVQIEARHREALHSALLTGVQAALDQGPSAGRDVIVRQAIDYARTSVPQAIKKLGPDNFIIRKLAERYANEVLGQLSDKVPLRLAE
jgi:hypothetical protein